MTVFLWVLVICVTWLALGYLATRALLILEPFHEKDEVGVLVFSVFLGPLSWLFVIWSVIDKNTANISKTEKVNKFFHVKEDK